MGEKPARMEKVLGSDGIKFSIVILSVADHPQLRMISRSREICFSAGVGKQQVPRLRSVLRRSGGRTFARNDRNVATKRGSGVYAIFLRTRAEFFDPNPTQLQIACSTCALRPASGT